MIRTEVMEDNGNLIESLIERAVGYGKTSFELAKLKAVDKTSEAVSSFVPKAIVIVFILSFVLFLSLGFALWLGEILGKSYLGFFVVAAFYGISGIFVRLFMHKWIKRCVSNNFIRQVLK
jgi:hypothetical protein